MGFLRPNKEPVPLRYGGSGRPKAVLPGNLVG